MDEFWGSKFQDETSEVLEPSFFLCFRYRSYKYNLLGPNLVSYKKIGPNKKIKETHGCKNGASGIYEPQDLYKRWHQLLVCLWTPPYVPTVYPTDTHFVGSEWSSWFANPVQRSIIFSQVLPILVDAFLCLASQSLCNQLFVKKGSNLFRDPGIFCSKTWGPKTAEIWGPRTQSYESIWIHTCFWVNIGFGIYWSCALKKLVVPVYKTDSPIKNWYLVFSL